MNADRFLFVLLAASLLLAGCAGQSGNSRQAAALRAQQQTIAAQQEALHPSVWFRGTIKHARVPWSEGLNLSRAIAAAEYTGTLDPRSIKITREGQSWFVKPRELLRGQDDPELLPGDLVELLR